jgi:hypothetical protein
MSGSLVFVGTHRIQEGKLDIAKRASGELAELVRDKHPRVLHFEIYIDDATREMTVIQIHPDEESLMLHMQLAGEHLARAYEFLDTEVVRIFGSVSEPFKAKVGMAGANVRFEQAFVGFSRLVGVAA